jgi:hypothetical protein
MNSKLVRIGTVYIPVQSVKAETDWYVTHLGAVVSYSDEDKAIVNFADASFFLVKARVGERNFFYDVHGKKRFPITFEVDGFDELMALHEQLKVSGCNLVKLRTVAMQVIISFTKT